jgi:effector-binding domain-containing protein
MSEVEIKQIPAQLVASITVETSFATIGKEIQEAFRRLGELGHQVGFGEGAPGLVTHRMPEPASDGVFEIFMPISREAPAPQGIVVKTLPAARAATTVHVGRYEDVGPAYERVASWIGEHGHRSAGPPREVYLTAPDEVPEDQAVTEVQFPIA